MTIVHVKQMVNERTVEFDLTYDPDFVADQNTRFHLTRDNACEPEVTHLLARVLREGDFAVDAGANIGFFSLLMAKLVGTTGRVLAFEPGTNNIDKLRSNIKLNGLFNVMVNTAPLWDEAKPIKFYLAHDSGNNACVKSDVSLGEVELRATTLDETCKRIPKLLKIDVEGAEHRVLSGARLLLRQHIPYIVCEINANALERFGTDQHQLRALMGFSGMGTFLLDPKGGHPALIDRNTTIRSTVNNVNVLFSTMENVSAAWPEAWV